MIDNRKIKDRRSNDQKRENEYECNRRYSPDRRLNNISVVWVPMENIKAHPVTRLAFSRS